MADNVTLPLTGSGDASAVVATDDVGGAQYQRVKLDLGGDGAASPLVRGQQSAANSIPVTLPSDQGTLTVKEVRPATPSQSSVAGSASNVTLLASNANRLGATVFNDSTAVLYIKLGATASTTSFTFKAQPDGYYEVPFGYTGIIDGIWASATGNARLTELTT